MALSRKLVEAHLADVESKLKKVEASTKASPLKKCPHWRQAKAEVKKVKGRLAAIAKVEARNAELLAKKQSV